MHITSPSCENRNIPLQSCTSETPHAIPLSFKSPPPLHQLKVLSWMVHRESSTATFKGKDKDAKSQEGLGGILVDASNADKMSAILALAATSYCDNVVAPLFPSDRRRTFTRATLIVAPAAAVVRWRQQFEGDIKSGRMIMHVVENQADLVARTIQEVVEADLVVVNCDILDSEHRRSQSVSKSPNLLPKRSHHRLSGCGMGPRQTVIQYHDNRVPLDRNNTSSTWFVRPLNTILDSRQHSRQVQEGTLESAGDSKLIQTSTRSQPKYTEHG